MTDFTGFGLPAALLETLDRMGYTTPTPIQQQAIPLAMNGRDVLGSAQTGTGKTAAFGIPIVAKLLTSPRGSALILTPTRELAVQIQDIMNKLLGMTSIKSVLLIGGESMPAQSMKLRSRPRIIIGTPGRINDHLGRGTLMLNEVQFLVLDETDRMLDMGFAPQLEKIAKYLPGNRQTLMFSATFPDNIMSLASKYLKNPERVTVGQSNVAAIKIKQEIVYTTHEAKYSALLKELEQRTGSVLIFVRTKHGADRLAEKLTRSKHGAEAIHGNLQQRQRERVILNFRNQKHRVLVATDIAARGLDIPHIEHVINYDLPQCPEDYIHRIGRTARAGAEGSAVCLIAPEDNAKWKAIHRMMNPGEPAPRMPGAPHGNGGGHHNGGGNSRPGQKRRRPFGMRSGGAGRRPEKRAASN